LEEGDEEGGLAMFLMKIGKEMVAFRARMGSIWKFW